MAREGAVPCTTKDRRKLLPVCIICEKTPPGGIAGGILVSGRFLCARCEAEIVQARVGDNRYAQLKERIKQIWVRAWHLTY